MSNKAKRNAASVQAGTTVNPAPQPAASTAPARGESTARRVQGQADPQAVTDQAVFESEAMNLLADALGDGEGADEGTAELAQALTPARNKQRGQRTEARQQPGGTEDAAESEPSEEAATEENTGESTVSNEHADGDLANDEDAGDADETGDVTAEAGTETEQEQEQEEQDAETGSGDEDGRKWPKSYLKRINKLTTKIERLEEAAQDAATLREENQRLKEQMEQAGAGNGIPNVPVTSAEEGITQEIAKLEQTLDFIESNPDGATVGERTYTAEELRTLRRRYSDQLMDKRMDLRESQRARKASAQRIEEAVAQWHPDMAERNSQKRTAVEKLLGQYPVLKSDPFFKLLVADAVAHRASVAAQQKKAAHTTGTATNGAARPAGKPAPRPPGKPQAQPVTVNGRRQNTVSAQKRFMETGDSKAGLELVNSLFSGGD